MPVVQCLLRDDVSNPESDAAPMLQRMWARKLVHYPKLHPFPDEAQADYSGFGVPLEQCAALGHCSYQGQCQVRHNGESAFEPAPPPGRRCCPTLDSKYFSSFSLW